LATEEIRPANLVCGSCGPRKITLDKNSNWTHANYWSGESVNVGLIAIFSNLAKRDSRVGKARSVWARITYVPEGDNEERSPLSRGYVVDPATWFERRPTFSLSVVENAELLVALIAEIAEITPSPSIVSRFRPVEDHRLKHSDRDHPYLFGPLFPPGNIIARVTLTVNDLAVGPFRFLLKLGPPPTIEPLSEPQNSRPLLSRILNLRKGA